MSTTKLLMRGVPTLLLLVLLSSYGPAAERSNTINEPSYSDANTMALPQAAACKEGIVKASSVLHARVKSPEGATLGHVYDLVLAPDLKRVSYIALSRGGILGIGNSLYAIPWSSVSQGVNGSFVVPISEQQIKQSRGFRQDAWPTRATLQGAEPVAQSQTALENKSVQQRRFTRLKGMKAKGAQGASVGKVDDLVIAMDTGRIDYTVLSYGGILSLGARLAAIPQNAITLEPAMHLAQVDAPKETVVANSFTSGRWPDLASPTYSQQLARAFAVQPAAPALAYVPGETTEAAAPTPERPTTMMTPSPADLTGKFNPSNITSIEGTVLDQGRFQLTSSGPQMLWMRVRMTDGQIVLVNLGPQDYVSTQNFYVVPGDRIHLRGSEVSATAPGRQVFLATEATYSDHTLRLRSTNGTPLWEGQAAGQAPALGYVPGEEQTGTEAAGQAPTQFAPVGPIAVGAFDLSNLEKIEGTVVQVGKAQPAGGAPEVIWLRVRTNDGRMMDVQVGPRNYVSGQNFFVVDGDHVRMTGWNAQIPGKSGATPVFILANIAQDGHTLQLRNRDGEPLWTGTAGQRQPETMGQAPTERTPQTATPSEQATRPGTPGATTTPGTMSRSTTEPNEPNTP